MKKQILAHSAAQQITAYLREILIMIIYDKELIDIEDVFENDEVLLMKSTYKAKHFTVEQLSVGVKDKTGDIVRIVDISEKII